MQQRILKFHFGVGQFFSKKWVKKNQKKHRFKANFEPLCITLHNAIRFFHHPLPTQLSLYLTIEFVIHISTDWAYQVPLNLFSFSLRFCLYSEDYLSVVEYRPIYPILISYLFGHSVSIHFHCLGLTKLQTTVQLLTLTNFPNLYFKCVLVKV